MNRLLAFLLLLLVAEHASAQRKVRFPNDGHSYRRGRLEKQEVDSLRTLLTSIYGKAPSDTIFLQYFFNQPDIKCRLLINDTPDEDIRRWIAAEQQSLTDSALAHPGHSYYLLRQPGNRAGRVVLWKPGLRVDSVEAVRKLLHLKKSACNPSIVVLPTGEYLLMAQDAHFYVTHMPPVKWDALWAQ